MRDERFYNYLKKTGRKHNAIEKYLTILESYNKYLREKREVESPKNASTKDLVAFVEFHEKTKIHSLRLNFML